MARRQRREERREEALSELLGLAGTKMREAASVMDVRVDLAARPFIPPDETDPLLVEFAKERKAELVASVGLLGDVYRELALLTARIGDRDLEKLSGRFHFNYARLTLLVRWSPDPVALDKHQLEEAQAPAHEVGEVVDEIRTRALALLGR